MGLNINLHRREDDSQRAKDEEARREVPGKVGGVVVVHGHVLPLAEREEAPEVEPDEPDLPVVVARGDEEVAVQRHSIDGQRFAAVAGLGDLHLDALRGGLEGVLELIDEAAPCVPFGVRRDEPLLDRDVQIGLVLDQAGVRPKESMSLPGQVDASITSRLDQLCLVK